MVERGVNFGDRDYYELFHEHMNLQAAHAQSLEMLEMWLTAEPAKPETKKSECPF